LLPVRCAQLIETVRGAGYRMTQQVSEPSAST
jgi:DNA-binding winged helix-turn-helix (wHTH) protein